MISLSDRWQKARTPEPIFVLQLPVSGVLRTAQVLKGDFDSNRGCSSVVLRLEDLQRYNYHVSKTDAGSAGCSQQCEQGADGSQCPGGPVNESDMLALLNSCLDVLTTGAGSRRVER